MSRVALDTYIFGNCFRSRLDARWALFSNQLGIQYRYEPPGIFKGSGYLLDFLVPKQPRFDRDLAFEVKPPGVERAELKKAFDNATEELPIAVINPSFSVGGG